MGGSMMATFPVVPQLITVLHFDHVTIPLDVYCKENEVEIVVDKRDYWHHR